MFRERMKERARAEGRRRRIASSILLDGEVHAQVVDPPAPQFHGMLEDHDPAFVAVSLDRPAITLWLGWRFVRRAASISSASFLLRKTEASRSW